MGFKRVIAASVFLALLVAGLSLFLAFTHLTSLAQARAWVAHSHAVKEATQDVFSFVGLNLFQSAFTNWCPMMTFLRKLGVRP